MLYTKKYSHIVQISKTYTHTYIPILKFHITAKQPNLIPGAKINEPLA